MADINIDIQRPEDLPTNRSYYIALNEKLRQYGLSQLIVEDDMVFKDELHKILGIGLKLES